MVRGTSWCHSGMPVTMFRGMSVVLLLLFLFSCTRAFRLGGTRTRPLQTQAAPLEMRLEDGKVLIIQNKGNYLTSHILRLFSSLSTCLPPISSLRCSYCALVYVLHIGGGSWWNWLPAVQNIEGAVAKFADYHVAGWMQLQETTFLQLWRWFGEKWDWSSGRQVDGTWKWFNHITF